MDLAPHTDLRAPEAILWSAWDAHRLLVARADHLQVWSHDGSLIHTVQHSVRSAAHVSDDVIALLVNDDVLLHSYAEGTKRSLTLQDATRVLGNRRFLVVVRRSEIVVLNPANLAHIHAIPASSLDLAPAPVVALSGRLLAYASPAPPPSPPPTPSPASSSPAADVAARLVSGIKLLGGIAYEAAKARVTPPPGRQGRFPRFLSRSAPDPPAFDGSTPSSFSSANSAPHDPQPYHVTIIDLAATRTIHIIPTSRSQPISGIYFAPDGTSLAVAPRNGHSLKLFKLVPGGQPSHLYTLRRGRSNTHIHSVAWSQDGRWLALGSANRTIHLFPINPYGGTPDLASHFAPAVKNIDHIHAQHVEQAPLLRVHAPKQDPGDQPIHFVPHTDTISLLVFNPDDISLSVRRITLDKRPIPDIMTSISLPGLPSPAKLSSPSTSVGSRNDPPSVPSTPQQFQFLPKESLVARYSLNSAIVRRPVQSLPVHATTDHLSHAELSTSSNSTRVLPRTIYLSHQFSFHSLGEDYHALIHSARLDIPARKIQVRPQVPISAHALSDSDDPSYSDRHAIFIQQHHPFALPRDILPHHRHSSISSSDHHLHHHHSTGASPSSFDEPIASALSQSPFTSTSLPPILPMYPNGLPGTTPSRSFALRNAIPIRSIAANLGDGVNEGITRLRREMHRVRSPTSPPDHSSSSSTSSNVNHVGDPNTNANVENMTALEFDEADEDFLVDHPTSPRDPSPPLEASSSSLPTATSPAIAPPPLSTALSGTLPPRGPLSMSISHLPAFPDMDEDVVGSVDEDLFSGWDTKDRRAVEEAERFNDFLADDTIGSKTASPATSTTMSALSAQGIGASTPTNPVRPMSRKQKRKTKRR